MLHSAMFRSAMLDDAMRDESRTAAKARRRREAAGADEAGQIRISSIASSSHPGALAE
jgi:hypothetical protein